MSRYIRPKVPGAVVFFTVNLVDRGADTLVRHVGLLREAVAVTRAKRPFGIDAWVVLPNHMHCVWTLPEGDADFSGRMSEIKGRFTRALRRSGPALTLAPENPYGARGGRERAGFKGVGAGPDLRREAAVWQKWFWEHHIRNDEAFAACVRYCWINPVKHGLVGHLRDWPLEYVGTSIRQVDKKRACIVTPKPPQTPATRPCSCRRSPASLSHLPADVSTPQSPSHSTSPPHPVVLERPKRQRHPVPDAGRNRLGVDADLILGVGVVAQAPAIPWLLDGKLVRTRDTLAAVLADFDAGTRVVPGHGPVTDISAIKWSVDYLTAVEAGVTAAIADGLSLEDTVARVQLLEFQGYALFGWLHPNLNVPAAYADLQ